MTARRAFVLALAALSSVWSYTSASALCAAPRNEIYETVAVKTDDGFVVAYSFGFDGTSEIGVRTIKLGANGKATGVKATHRTFGRGSASLVLRPNGNDATLTIIEHEHEPSRSRSEVVVSSGPAFGALNRVATLPVAVRGEGEGVATKDGFLLRVTGSNQADDRSNEFVALDANGALVARSSHPGIDKGHVALGLGGFGAIVSRYQHGSEPAVELYGLSNDGKTITCSGATCSPENPPVKMRIGGASRGAPRMAFGPTNDGGVVVASSDDGTDVAHVSSTWTLTQHPRLTTAGSPTAYNNRRGDVVVFFEDRQSPSVVIASAEGKSVGTAIDRGARRAPLACNAEACLGLELRNGEVVAHLLDDDLVPKSTEVIEAAQPAVNEPCNDSPEVDSGCSVTRRTRSFGGFGLVAVALAIALRRWRIRSRRRRDRAA